MSASAGDWWHNAIEVAQEALYRIDPSRVSDNEIARCVLDAVLPLFVAEATRRLEAERDENATYNYGLDTAAALVRGLADPGTEQQ